MGYDFDIQYKEGISNKAADALSRKASAELLALLLGNGHSDLMALIQAQWQSDPVLKSLIEDLVKNPVSHPKYTWTRNELRCRENWL